MPGKALYLLARFDDETEGRLAGLYAALRECGFEGRQTTNLPYHFTLGSFGAEYEDRLPGEMERICAKTGVIDICLSHLGLFGLNVLFIVPNMNFELLELQRSFFGGCGGCHPWTAHATILIDEHEAVLRALPIVAEGFEPFCARIESVMLYELFPARFIRECGLRPRTAPGGS